MTPPLSKVGMVKTIEIENFRGFPQLRVEGLARVNVVVGDNGVGKTALLEAMYLTLCSSADRGFVLKQWRGQPMAFRAGSADDLAEVVFSDLFHDPSSGPVKIKLTGLGYENRRLTIERTKGSRTIPLSPPEGSDGVQFAELSQTSVAPIELVWQDEGGVKHSGFIRMNPAGITFDDTGENGPSSYFYAAQVQPPPSEPADMYTALATKRAAAGFRRVFMSVFDDITDISVASSAGASSLMADVPWATRLLPLTVLSGGTTRAAAFLLAITARRDGLVMIDEVEAGIYYLRQKQLAQAILELSAEYKTQVIMTSHSEEWLQNFLEAANVDDDIAFWRLERSRNNSVRVQKFTVQEFSRGFDAGEMR